MVEVYRSVSSDGFGFLTEVGRLRMRQRLSLEERQSVKLSWRRESWKRLEMFNIRLPGRIKVLSNTAN